MKEIKNAYLREAGACFPHDVFLLPAEDESKVIMRGDLSSARIWDIEHGIHYHVWKILLGERTTRNLIFESYHCLPAKCACQRNWPTNKMGSHFSAGRSENCLKVWGVIWQFDQQFLLVISSGRHKPTPVRAAGCCEMSPYYLSAAKAEGCVVRQAFGKGSEYEWEGGNALNTVERWSGQCMGFSLQRWRYIERVNEDGLNSQEGCGAETASAHRKLWIVLCSHSILPSPPVHLNAAHCLTMNLLRVF